MNSTAKKLAMIGLALAVQGCAMKAQDIHLDPQLTLKAAPGADKVVGVEAHDTRPTRLLGVVGVVDPRRAEISSKEDAGPALYVRVANGLKAQGFSVKAVGDSDDRVLRVEIAELAYQTTKSNSVTDEVEVVARVIGRARNKGEWHDRQFTVTKKKSVGVLPGVEENTRFVNDAVAQALNDMLSDQVLIDLLSK
jgi:uncharacterized lipoprotein YajG